MTTGPGTINLTPHRVSVHSSHHGEDHVYEPHVSGPARAMEYVVPPEKKDLPRYPVGWTEEGVVVYMPPEFIGVSNLPGPDSGVNTIIVSTIVADLLQTKRHSHLFTGTVLVPDSGPNSAKRNADGQITSVSGLLHRGGPAPRDSTGHWAFDPRSTPLYKGSDDEK